MAFELDLPGYRFGWRQLAATAGRRGAGAGGRSRCSSRPARVAGTCRAPTPARCWPSSPTSRAATTGSSGSAHPTPCRWRPEPSTPGIGFATSYNGEPDVTDQWITAQQGATPALAADLRLVQNGLTTKFGHLLAPMAVRYMVVPNHNGPAGAGARPVPTPDALLAGLQLQTDLQVVNVDPNYTVYQNAAWAPAAGRAAAGGGCRRRGRPGRPARALQETDLTGAAPVLDDGQPDPGLRPGARPDRPCTWPQTRQSGWRLHVGGTVGPPAAGVRLGHELRRPRRLGGRGPGRPWRLPPVVGVARRPDRRDPALGWWPSPWSPSICAAGGPSIRRRRPCARSGSRR